MKERVLLLLELGKPRVLALMCLLALCGAALSPSFLSPYFPLTRIGGTIPFLWLHTTWPRLFSPSMWSLAHALGASFVTGLLWLGTALINDLTDSEIDQVSNPDRPIPSRRVPQQRVLSWALGCEALALGLVLLEGSRGAMFLALAGATLGNLYSLPPIRLRQNGIVANLVIGGGVTMAMTGGMLSQEGVTQVGFLSSVAIGILASASSMVKGIGFSC